MLLQLYVPWINKTDLTEKVSGSDENDVSAGNGQSHSRELRANIGFGDEINIGLDDEINIGLGDEIHA